MSADNPEEFFEQRLRSNGRHEARLRSADGRSATAMKAAEAEALLGAQRAKDAGARCQRGGSGPPSFQLDSMRAHLQRNKEEFARYELIQDQEAQSRLRSADGRRLLDAEKEAAAAAAAAAATAANAAAGAACESAQVAALKIEGLENCRKSGKGVSASRARKHLSFCCKSKEAVGRTTTGVRKRN